MQLRFLDYFGDALAGDLVFDAGMIKDWANQGYRAVVVSVPVSMIPLLSKKEAFAPDTGVVVETIHIGEVMRKDGAGRFVGCEEVTLSQFNRANHVDSLFYPTLLTPVFVKEPQTDDTTKVKVLPASAVATDAEMVYVAHTELDPSTATAIAGMPNELEHLVMIYMVIQGKMREAGYARRKSQDELESITGTPASVATTAFSNQTSVTVTHNLGFYPIVQVIDGSGNNIDFECKHTSTSELVVSFAVSQSGTILVGSRTGGYLATFEGALPSFTAPSNPSMPVLSLSSMTTLPSSGIGAVSINSPGSLSMPSVPTLPVLALVSMASLPSALTEADISFSGITSPSYTPPTKPVVGVLTIANKTLPTTYVEGFTSQTTLTVTHNLGFYPVVTIIDTSGNVVDAEVTYNSVNQITIVFAVSQSGTVLLGDVTDILPGDIVFPTLSLTDAPDFTDLDLSGVSVPSVTLAFVTAGDEPEDTISVAQSIPTYSGPTTIVLPTLSLTTAPAFTDLDLSGVSAPSRLSHALPIYAGPTAFAFSETVISDALTKGDDLIDTDFDAEFAADEYEMAMSAVAAANAEAGRARAAVESERAQIQDFTEKVREALGKFNTEMDGYKAETQDTSVDIANYREEVNAVVNEWLGEEVQFKLVKWQGQVNSEIEEFRAKSIAIVSKFQSEVQEALGKFNNEISAYEAELAKEVAEARVDVDAYRAKLDDNKADLDEQIAQYQGDISKYREQINAGVNEWLAEEVNFKLDKWKGQVQSELGQYRERAGALVGKYGAEASAKVGKYGVDVEKRIQDFRAEMDAQVNEFRYQEEAKVNIYNANINEAVGKYRTEIEEYIGDVRKLVDQYVAEAGSDAEIYRANFEKLFSDFRAQNEALINEFQSRATSIIALYRAEIEDNISEFTANVDYRMKEATHTLEKEVQSYSQQVTAYINEFRAKVESEIGEYSAKVDAVINEYAALVNGQTQEFQSNMAKALSYLQEVEVVLGVANSYDNKSNLALQEVVVLQKQFSDSIKLLVGEQA